MAIARAPFLRTKFGGYHHRNVPPEDAELTHVGPATPCGEYFRRFWQPVCYADDIADLPIKLRILGEELVVFRDQRGADVALQARQKPNRWVMLGDIVPKLGVSWQEAEAAAQFAAAKPREWIEHHTHSLMLRQAGREMLEEQTTQVATKASTAGFQGASAAFKTK